MRREHPLYEFTDWPEYEFREYPMMTYPGSADNGKSPDRDERGRPVQKGVIVNSDEELHAVLSAEVKTIPIGPEKNAPERVETADDAKTALLAEAKKLNVEVDAKWSIARIEQAIADSGTD